VAATRKAMQAAGVHRKGLGFYCARHVFQTIADNARDPVATSSVMGHVASSGDMSARYRERVPDDRLLAVADVVHKWLFPPTE